MTIDRLVALREATHSALMGAITLKYADGMKPLEVPVDMLLSDVQAAHNIATQLLYEATASELQSSEVPDGSGRA